MLHTYFSEAIELLGGDCLSTIQYEHSDCAEAIEAVEFSLRGPGGRTQFGNACWCRQFAAMAHCRGSMSAKIRCLLPLLLLLLFVDAMVQALNVSYDHRAVLLDGKRRLLVAAGIHYPRATPEVRSQLACFFQIVNKLIE